jgi:hypothetical protein
MRRTARLMQDVKEQCECHQITFDRFIFPMRSSNALAVFTETLAVLSDD